MKLYCLCEAQAGTVAASKPDHQVYLAPNRYLAVTAVPLETEVSTDDFPPLALKRPMEMIKMGARQGILVDHKPNDWSGSGRPTQAREHFPRVDVYECPHCKARVVRE